MIFTDQLPDFRAQPRAELRVGQGELDEGLEVALEVADVVALLAGAEPHADDPLALPEQEPDGVGQLQLAATVERRLPDRGEDARREDVARGDGEVARGLGGRRLLDQVGDLEDLPDPRGLTMP